MDLAIKGRMVKVEDGWITEFPQYNLQLKAQGPYQLIKAVAGHIMERFKEKEMEYSIKMEDEGVYFIYPTESQSFSHEDLRKWNEGWV